MAGDAGTKERPYLCAMASYLGFVGPPADLTTRHRPRTFYLRGGESMLGVRVKISRCADAWQPGWVECRLVDALGHEHVFVEKVPVVTKAHLDAASSFPRAGTIACIMVGRSERDCRQVVRIDTQTPWASNPRLGEVDLIFCRSNYASFLAKNGSDSIALPRRSVYSPAAAERESVATQIGGLPRG
jgi:hypothetical protein